MIHEREVRGVKGAEAGYEEGAQPETPELLRLIRTARASHKPQPQPTAPPIQSRRARFGFD